MEVDKSLYPVVGYNFKVTSSDAMLGLGLVTELTGFEVGQADASFKTVSGLEATLDVGKYNQLGSTNRQVNLPGNVSYQNLELIKGIVNKDSTLGKWCYGFLTDDQWWYMVQLKTLNVFLMDNDSKDIVMSWSFYNCFPVGIKINPFDAMENTYAVETLTLCYSHFNKS